MMILEKVMRALPAYASAGLSDAARRAAVFLAPVGLDDRYSLTSGSMFLCGIQSSVQSLLRSPYVRHLPLGLTTCRGNP
jgi:hypothetical protein